MCSMKGELRVRERAYADPVLDTLVELNGTVDQREQRVVLATANVLTREEPSPFLCAIVYTYSFVTSVIYSATEASATASASALTAFLAREVAWTFTIFSLVSC